MFDTVMVCPKAPYGEAHQFGQVIASDWHHLAGKPLPHSWICVWCGLRAGGYMPKELRFYVISEELEPW